MDIADMYRRSRQFTCSVWKQLRDMGSLRFLDAAQERRFVQHAGEHGLSVMRMHRVVDASLFFFSAKESPRRYSNAGLAAFISTASRWASALQLLALATTLFAPRFVARNHESIKVVCQHINFLTVIAMLWVITSDKSRYQIAHACNAMFSAVNFLPGQVRVSVFAPIVVVQSLIWIYAGARSRVLNPEHAGAPLTTLWLWTQHVSLTVFMSFVLTYCVGTVLEMHARQSFVKAHGLEDLEWQPGVLPRLMMQTLKHLRKTKSRLLEVLGMHKKQQAMTDAGEQVGKAAGVERWECKQVLDAAQTDTQESFRTESAKYSGGNASEACAGSACCPGIQCQPGYSMQTLPGCSSDPASSRQAAKVPGSAAQAQHVAQSCRPSNLEAELAHAHRDVSLAVGYQGKMCGDSSLSTSSAVSNSDSGSDADVSEAEKVCCGVQGEQAHACQKLLNKGKALDSKCRQLACRVELLETEVGKDSLAAMAEQVRSRQLLHQIAALTQRMNAQRCVTTFLGSQEEALILEVESLRKERNQLTEELSKAHALVEETAADRLEATELLSRAVHIMESMRDHMSTERQTMWQCILQMLHLQPDAKPAQASASFARSVGKDSCADGGDLARFLQALADESTLSHRASQVSIQSASESSSSSRCSQLRGSREGSQHSRTAGSVEAPAATQREQREVPGITDPQLSEVLHQIRSCRLPDPISTTAWPARDDSMQQSSVQGAQHPAALDPHMGTADRVGSIASMGDLGDEVPGNTSRKSCEGTARSSNPADLLEVKQQQDASWDSGVNGQVKELYFSVLRRIDTGAAAQRAWLSSAKSALSGSIQQPCTTCKAASEKVAEVEKQHAGLQGAIVVILRSMMAQERSLCAELGQLASELRASLSTQGKSRGQHLASSSAESPLQQRRSRPRKCTTPNTLAGGQHGLGELAGCCWPGIEEPDWNGQAARAVAQRLQQLSEASASSQQAASEVMEMLFPVPSIREINTSLTSSSQAEAHMSKSLTQMASWLHTANSPEHSNVAAKQVCVERLRGALEVTVSSLVDRAFATQTAYVHCAHSLSKQMQALTSLNTQLMNVRQSERRMLEMLMNNRARLLTHMAVLRTCTRVALCHECHAPAAPDSLATSPAA